VNYSAGGRGATCPIVTLEGFRVLDQILFESGGRAMERTGTLEFEYRDVDAVPSFVGGIQVIGPLPDGTFAECCPG
jgi:hypothetical protein